eukprot:1006215-Rhodomonas_salina.1
MLPEYRQSLEQIPGYPGTRVPGYPRWVSAAKPWVQTSKFNLAAQRLSPRVPLIITRRYPGKTTYIVPVGYPGTRVPTRVPGYPGIWVPVPRVALCGLVPGYPGSWNQSYKFTTLGSDLQSPEN